MSFILDALQKAEHGRPNAPEATTAITPAPIPVAPPDTRRWVIIGLAAALLVVAVAVAFFVRDARAPRHAPAAAPIAANQPQRATPPPATRPLQAEANRATASRDGVRALDQEVNRPDPARPAPQASAATQSASAPVRPVQPGTVTIMQPEEMAALETPPAAARTAPAGLPAASVPAATPNEYPGLPEYDNLLRAGRINLPNLSMDMHVYNSQPAKRFVFINLKKYREGDTIEGKARIEAITANGAVLDNNGLRFLLRPN